MDGHPYGSLVPFMLDQDGRPVLLVSQLAEHTRNISADPRTSLLAFSSEQDPQAGARATVMGTAKPVVDQLQPRARYLRYFPDAARLLDMQDFLFICIEPLCIRYIGGFGAIRWVAGAEYLAGADCLRGAEEQVLAECNRLFGTELYCHGSFDAGSSIIGIDCDGFDVRKKNDVVRFDFPGAAGDPGKALAAFKAILQFVPGKPRETGAE
jgi:hypothetical protein